jgi:hypothetical protein
VIEDRIKDQRHIALTLANERAREEAAARNGRYVLAEDAKQEIGRVISRLMTLFEASLNEFSNAMIEAGAPKDSLKILKTVWNEVRTREATTCAAEAAQIEQFVEIEK